MLHRPQKSSVGILFLGTHTLQSAPGIMCELPAGIALPLLGPTSSAGDASMESLQLLSLSTWLEMASLPS